MADNYCKCKGCKYIDPNSRSGYKWYCTYYGRYEDPDRVQECSHFVNQDSGGGCFLTSACCEYMGLADDCKELTTLRNFRDNHLKKTQDGAALVARYYEIAPGIVEKINAHSEKDKIYKDIYTEVCRICTMIDAQEYNAAIEAYRTMVELVGGETVHRR